MSLAFDYERAPMCAYVRQASHSAFVVRRENERLVEAAFQKSHGRHPTGRFYATRIPDPLPAAGENSILLQLEVLGIRVHATRQRRRAPNVLVDLEIAD